jgi:hypothetical protein
VQGTKGLRSEKLRLSPSLERTWLTPQSVIPARRHLLGRGQCTATCLMLVETVAQGFCAAEPIETGLLPHASISTERRATGATKSRGQGEGQTCHREMGQTQGPRIKKTKGPLVLLVLESAPQLGLGLFSGTSACSVTCRPRRGSEDPSPAPGLRDGAPV